MKTESSFSFFSKYLNERAICVCEQRVGRALVQAKARLSLPLAPAKLAARGFRVPTLEHRALSQISSKRDCAQPNLVREGPPKKHIQIS